MALKEKIIEIKPREFSGSVSSSRFDYQKDWSICKLIECHKTESDYLIIFDWHEDLLLIDSESCPEKISFYQIKGKKHGTWSTAQLIKSGLAKDGSLLFSIIGKLFDCKSKYEIETTSLNFVSNARFSVNLEDNSSSLSKDIICIIELSKPEKEKIKRKIQDEHHLSTDPLIEDITFLRVTDLSLEDSKIHTQGKISEFLYSIYGARKFSIPTIYKLLFDEVRRRASYNKEILNFDDLLSNKGICKRQFDKIIETAGINKDYDETWKHLEMVLQTEMDFQELKKLKQEWKRLELERMDANNSYLVQLIEMIKLLSNSESLKGLKIWEVTNSIFHAINTRYSLPINYNEQFVKAIILTAVYE